MKALKFSHIKKPQYLILAAISLALVNCNDLDIKGSKDTTTTQSSQLPQKNSIEPNIKISKDEVDIYEPITLDGSTSTIPKDTQVTFKWLDENGNLLSTNPKVNLSFSKDGTHTIKLVISTQNGEEVSKTIKINVGNHLDTLLLKPQKETVKLGEESYLSIVGEYSNGKRIDLTKYAKITITNPDIISITKDGKIIPKKGGNTTIKAQIGNIGSVEIQINVLDLEHIKELRVAPNPIKLTTKGKSRIDVKAIYEDGSAIVTRYANLKIENSSIATLNNDQIEAKSPGSTYLIVELDKYSKKIPISVVESKVNLSALEEGEFSKDYIDSIPADANKTYDVSNFCMIGGKVVDEKGEGVENVLVEILNHPEYGSVLTKGDGYFALPAEAKDGTIIRFSKDGYLTVDREINTSKEMWNSTPTITLLKQDNKTTNVKVDGSIQVHRASIVEDKSGKRAATLVFKDITKATVTDPHGNTRELKDFTVRATEFKTPESMPSDLPSNSAFTYCVDLQVDGVGDEESVVFNKPVVLYTENFLNFPVGEPVPVGYYDRNDGKWKASDNGIVVKLLDDNGDGIVDGLDATGDGKADDLNNNGDTTDEVAGIKDMPEIYKPGNTYFRTEITHFTPWDTNFPYGPPDGTVTPSCPTVYATNISCAIYEDPIASQLPSDTGGKDIVINVSSPIIARDENGAVKTIKIGADIDLTNYKRKPDGAYAILDIAGKRIKKNLEIGKVNHVTFLWDGKDARGREYNGKLKAKVTVAYRYKLVYYRSSLQFKQAWNRAGREPTSIVGRSAIDYKSSSTLNLIKSKDCSLFRIKVE